MEGFLNDYRFSLFPVFGWVTTSKGDYSLLTTHYSNVETPKVQTIDQLTVSHSSLNMALKYLCYSVEFFPLAHWRVRTMFLGSLEPTIKFLLQGAVIESIVYC